MTPWLAASRRIQRRRLAGLVLAAACACGDDELRTRSYHDIGSICLQATADGQLTFFVSISPPDPCLSYCEEHVTSCSATLEGGRVELRTLLESKPIPGVEVCPAACRDGISGSCTLEAMPPGEYHFGFASRADTATVPLDGRVPLFGDRECNSRERSTIPNPFQ